MHAYAEGFTFADHCEAAFTSAVQLANPFVPSRAQIEQCLTPLVDRLVAMNRNDAKAYILASFNIYGSMPYAIAMYKERIGFLGKGN